MKCKKCGTFEKHKSGECKACNKEWQKLYNLTPKGKAVKMWSSIIKRAENKFGKRPTYANIKLLMAKEEFYAWVIPELEKWILTQPIKLASVDRKDNNGHYEISNLQLLDRWENSLKKGNNKNVNAPDGYAWCYKCKDYLLLDEFNKSKNKFNGLQAICKFHRSLKHSDESNVVA